MSQATNLKLPGYVIVEQLYVSSRTEVCRATRECDRQPVVIKLLRREHPSFNELLQFRNQYTISKSLNLPGVVRPYCLEPYGSSYALVMEDTSSTSLELWAKQRCRQNQANEGNRNGDRKSACLLVSEFLDIAIQLADILHHLHQKRVIHKDIKPANVLINPETGQVKLIDFSIASLLPQAAQSVQNSNGGGTTAYISPEQTGRMNRGVDYRSDFYSLGVTFFELLTGQLPFTATDSIELIHCHLAKQPPLAHSINSKIPPVLSEIINKLMAKNAEERYQTALGFKRDLEQCLNQLTTTGWIIPFELGQFDICDRPIIPQTLYGRETEIQCLLDAFEQVAQGTSQMLLVAGSSGIGKTAIVSEVRKPIVRQRGYFIKGKFDQFNRDIPLSAITQALRELIEQLSTETTQQLETWKARILAALGNSGQTLIELIPELEQIIGQQPEIPELTGLAAQSRFNLLFQKFIQVFTSLEHPLVLFLDDLQWADAASLKLIQILMTENIGYLFLIGAYRDHEVSPIHPLMMTLDEMRKANTIIQTITLPPLQLQHINQLVAKTLNCSIARSQPLAELIYSKAEGNPFFSNQFLKALFDDQLIYFNTTDCAWECDLSQIQQLAMLEEVAEFIAQRLKKLPEPTQAVLQFAACMGNQFDLTTLAIVSEQPEAEVAANLWCALQEGLVLPYTEVYKFYVGQEHHAPLPTSIPTIRYKFLHDRIQQAAYSLIPSEHRQAIHYHIGQRLLANLPETAQNEKLFDIVNQINFGLQLLDEFVEREELARLNLVAGQRAMLSTAYDAATRYFETGIQLLSKDAWINQYDLIYGLYCGLAKVQLCCAKFQQLEETTKLILEYLTYPIDRANIYTIQTIQYTLQGYYSEAIRVGLTGLNQLGVEISQACLTETIEAESTAIASSLANYSIDSLLDLPTATNPVVRAAIKLLIALDPPTYITANFDLYTLVTLKATKLSIQHGNIAESVKAYVNYGLLLNLTQGQYQRGYEFAKMAVQLSFNLNSKSEQCKACLLLGSWIQVWAKPLTGAASINYEGFMAGIDAGEIQFAGYNLMGNIFNRLFQGENFDAIADDIEKFWLMANKSQNELLLSTLAIAELFIITLSSTENRHNNSVLELEALINHAKDSQAWLAVGLHAILKMQLSCLTGRFESGLSHLLEAKAILNSITGFTTYSGYYYYGSLILLNLVAAPELQEDDFLQQVRANQQKLKEWSDSCSENFLHKYLLVEAEFCRVTGDRITAIDLYDQAIAEARVNGYVQEEALASEMAAKFYLFWNKTKLAQDYLVNAYYGYARWGAKAKLDQLEVQYPGLLTPVLQPSSTSSDETDSVADAAFLSVHGKSTSTEMSVMLDLATILKASQALSSEIDLKRLLSTLLQVMLETAGADKCVLMLMQNEQLLVQGIIVNHSSSTVLQHIPVETSQDLPVGLVHSVQRNLQPIVLTNAVAHSTLMGDPYIQRQQPKSILCSPILSQGKLVSVLYLENNLIIGAFTNDRIELLNLLCTQSAIALENAHLYAREQEKSQQLELSLNQLQQSETRLKQLFEKSADAILLLSQTNLMDCNQSALNLFGYAHKEQFRSVDLAQISPQFQPNGQLSSTYAKQMIDEALQQGSHLFEWVYQRSNRKEFWAEVVLTVIPYESEQVLHAVVRNISDRKQAEVGLRESEQKLRHQAEDLQSALQELQSTQMQLIQSEKMSALGNLVAGVAHEINNPVGFIAGNVDPAKDYVNDLLGLIDLYQEKYPQLDSEICDEIAAIDLDYVREDLPKLLDSMSVGVQRIRDISTSLRTFSRADSDRPTSFNVHEGIDSTVLILKHRFKANQTRPAIQIVKHYGEIPAVECFPGQLNQVFMNVLANAIDALEDSNQSRTFAEIEANPNCIIIKTELDNQIVSITIADNGIGMMEDVKQRVFDHLFTTKTVGKGTGLGLAIAHQIVVEKHNGTIEVNSVLGRGTEFVITLPVRANHST